MKELDFKYGFPLLITSRSVANLIKIERNRASDRWSFWDYIIKQHLYRKGKVAETILSPVSSMGNKQKLLKNK